MSTLLRDVLVIPERTGAEDYVLRLSDSIDDSAVARTLDEYVVTKPLEAAFDAALNLVAEALRSGVSRGAFLTGSFGSGKSHFMAVLHSLLRRNAAARGKEELQPVIARHDPDLLDRNILPLAFHLLGAESLEQALFDGYLRQIKALHPNAPLPALHKSDALLADADRLRTSMGDQKFFAGLNRDGNSGADPWGALIGSQSWTVESYAAARSAAPATVSRQQLVTRLVERYFSAFTSGAEFVDIDTGLAAMANHAQALKYDAVVLMLDELVLWLAFSVQHHSFFGREAQKLTKLVESSVGIRAIPIVSFVARQMDLRRWFATAGASGAEQDALDSAFRHQEGRFSVITLGDDNLPYVANRRLLRPRDADAAEVLTNAFSRLDRRPDLWDVLLDGINTDERHRGADEAAFRLTYPFSPALVSTLRSLASAMQRERTALKVMQEMLVDRRDWLTVDDLIPVGDAFDYVVEGKEALDSIVAQRFRAATALFRDKLRPLLLVTHGITVDEASGPLDKLPGGFRADVRLAKTLLLAAVAPEVPALKELTASRVASLNHGSIVSPLPGSEAGIVLAKVRDWSLRVPEIHVNGDVRNPVIRVVLSEVDYESVLERAKGEDNEGRRRELLKELVRDALGITTRDDNLLRTHSHLIVWRGSKREVDVVFGNARDAGWLTDEHFRARPGTWRFVVDHPFDESGHSIAEDLARLDRLRESGLTSQTVVWLPRFFSEERMRQVSRLVVLDYVLGGTGEHWTTYADHLSEADRHQARAILEAQRSAMREGLRRASQEAYGAAAPTRGTLIDDAAHERVLVSLDPGFNPIAPVGADLQAAFANLIDQAFSALYPGHPQFEPDQVPVTVSELTAVYEHIQRALATSDGRVPLQGNEKSIRRVANSLHVGTAGETHFLFGAERFPYATEFEKAASRDNLQQEPIEVARLRAWLAQIEPALGLREEVADLVILAWAALRQRAWFHYGSALLPPKPGQLRNEMELRIQPLPDSQDWDRAVSRAAVLLGVNASRYLTGPAVAELAEKVRDAAASRSDSAQALIQQLTRAYGQTKLGEPLQSRLATARAAAGLLGKLRQASDRVGLVAMLAHDDLPASDEATARSISAAASVADGLASFRWDRLAPVVDATGEAGPRGKMAARIFESIQNVLREDEFAAALAPALVKCENSVFEWLSAFPPALPPLPTPTASGSAKLMPGQDRADVMHPLQKFLDKHPDKTVVVDWRVEE